MDSDEDLQLPPPKTPINLDDSDDDLPPPAALAVKGPPPVKPAGPALTSPKNKPVALNKNGVSSPLMGSPLNNTAAQRGAQYLDPQQQQLPFTSETRARVNPAKVYKEGFLFKQQPSWPYSNQKRYCVIKNCRLYYFDSQESMKEGKPQGVIDLTSAKLVDPGNEAKLPSSFGIHVASDRQAEGGGSVKKERTFTFSVMHAHELGEWKAAIQSVVGDPAEDEKVHWFEKMVQGVY
ncbi:hypothetical protein TcCL_NonESM08092 [Trypanosoma cruzi]|uniref:PH domain-containing protein n=2 Tax=Trypanosoma cruzi TaxID=5693 RepID=Q4DJF5_TRYCC|nr:hypothetical protein Tc00.1047053507991.40 [Trypanosoma cruzi]EAN92649.1 hypothetical protein Tc00.1047053507991.40 [Trypanosoma cruzi]KAF8287282.1 hypothetical protein TcBrA4_0009930 [Trypanosoma cruzi]PWU93213.1 hypothetical protein C4B63_32g16 [Trypanosoma cruzi]RNC42286.1 hypothetical protein TcCL_NonESM08092 [Trypanosoma cruzi]RNF17517.1 hypothetical protein TcG_05454 [Trypanosoma cruzi]|eukprot:XP_814500.1 hypothetical protein [Trypanosoma cruzi strain CL Brener]